MKHDLDTAEYLVESLVTKVEFAKVERRMAPSGADVRFLDRPRIVRNKCIRTDDVMPIAQQALAQMRTDEPSRSRDQTLHAKDSKLAFDLFHFERFQSLFKRRHLPRH